MFNALMEHCYGKIDGNVKDFLEFVMIELGTAKTEKLKAKLWEVLSTALWYNSAIIIETLYEKNLVRDFL